jgi:hypothetical protein
MQKTTVLWCKVTGLDTIVVGQIILYHNLNFTVILSSVQVQCKCGVLLRCQNVRIEAGITDQPRLQRTLVPN